MRRNGSILVGLLWCLALLSISVLGVLHTSRMDLQVVKNYGDRVQAHYLALAGIERAKALLFRDAVRRRQTAKNHAGALYDDDSDFHDVPLGRGQFRVFHSGDGGLVYGISDEESRLNVNTAAPEVLAKIKDMSGDIVAAIVEWRGTGNQTNAGGAGPDYYASLAPPYLPRNGPLQTVGELLMVRGVTPELLLGSGAGSDGPADAGEAGEDEAAPEDGWAAILTVKSTDENVNAAGKTRVDVRSADEATLTAVQGISTTMARAIIAARGQTRLQSIADLLDVTDPSANRGTGGSSAANSPSGPGLISDDLLAQIGDNVTVGSDSDTAGLININTAGPAVLACLPGFDLTLAQAVISQRESGGFFANPAELLRVAGMTRDIFKRVAPLLTARSETFRVTSEGRVTSTGARQRAQAILHVGAREVQTLLYREDL